MRIALVSPPYRIVKNPKSEMSKNVHRRASPVLGLAILATTLHKRGHDVLYLDCALDGIENTWGWDAFTDCYGLTVQDAVDRVTTFGADVVCLTCMTSSQYTLVRRLGEAFAGVGIPVLVGGNHASMCARDICEHFYSVICGEADLVIADLVEKVGRLPKIVDVGRLHELCLSPKIDWGLLPLHSYWARALPQNPFPMSRKSILYETSRGCPENCCFCSTKRYFGNRFRPHSACRVVEEIAAARDIYGVEEIQFCDDSMAVNIKRFMDMVTMLKGEGLHLSNPSGIRLYENNMDRLEEIFSRMKDAGFYQTTFAVESGDEYILNKVIKKRLDLDWVKAAIPLAKKYFKVHAFFMIGLPHETRQQIERTIDFAKSLECDSYSLSLAQPFPYTDLWWQCRREKLFTEGVTEADMLMGNPTIRRDDGFDIKAYAEQALVELNG